MFNYWFTYIKVHFRITYLLIFLNVLLYIISVALTAFFEGNQYSALIYMGGQVLPGSIFPFSTMILEFWRFVTSSFLHAGPIHLIMNMLALYSVGSFIERFYSGKKLFLTYIFTALAGSVLSFLVSFLTYWQSNSVTDGLTVSIGASGAVFGLVGLLIGNRWKNKTYTAEMQIDYNSLMVFVVFNFLLGFGINLTGGAFLTVNNWAHLGGVLSGIVLGLILETRNTFDVGRFKKGFEMALFIFSLLIFISSEIASIIYMFS